MDDLEKQISSLEKGVAVLRAEIDGNNKALKTALDLQATSYNQQLSDLKARMESVERWMWKSIGAGIAGGGLAALIARALLK